MGVECIGEAFRWGQIKVVRALGNNEEKCVMNGSGVLLFLLLILHSLPVLKKVYASRRNTNDWYEC